jgi:hypothetical protein
MNLTARLKSRDYICRRCLSASCYSFPSFDVADTTSERHIGSYLRFVFANASAGNCLGIKANKSIFN